MLLLSRPVIVVVGSGVSGLSCALALLRSGYAVELWTRERPPRTTSNVAAAFWYPYRADPQERVTAWARSSHRFFASLTADPDTGITMRDAFDLARRPMARPWWADAVEGTRQARPDELPPGFAFAWVFRAPVIDTRRYLPWLERQVTQLGGRIVERTVSDLDAIAAEHGVVVNCTGLGARTLCRDPEMFPIRGQLVHVSDPGLDVVLLDEHDGPMSYVVPRGDDCVLGGTADVGDEDLQVRADEAASIVERCCRLAPALADSVRKADVVGLRPGRTTVRLELEARPGGYVVHDYGHGGAGVTLSWGCALEVVELVRGVAPSDAREARPS